MHCKCLIIIFFIFLLGCEQNNLNKNVLNQETVTKYKNSGFALVYDAASQEFVTNDLSTTTTAANFTANGTDTDFVVTSAVVDSIENTTVFINGIFQAPTYSYTISNDGIDTTIAFDAAPESGDIITVRYITGGTLNSAGLINENSTIDGGTY